MKRDEKKSKFKQFLEKFWFIVWKDDSLKGWIMSLIFLFVVIKLIFFPLMTLATGTQLPLVIVESCSMYHNGNVFSNYEEWFDRHDVKYLEYGITDYMFKEFPLKKGFNKGDILFITGTKPEKLEIGDIIIFQANYKNPVIHRIINITKEGDDYIFSTLGDNNKDQLSPPESRIDETKISQNQIVGKAQANIAPFLGWIKLIFFEGIQPPENKGFCEEN